MREVMCAGGIVVSPEERILVVLNRLGKVVLPKGTCEQGETPEETAFREVTEESGLPYIALVQGLGVLSRVGYTATNRTTPSVIKQIHMFHFTTDHTELGPFAPDIVDASWVSPDYLPAVLTWPEELAFFQQNRARLGL